MESSNSHLVKIIDRSNIIISGIKRIINFDDKQFNIESVMGNMIVKGNSLEIIKLDTIEGNITIKGNVDSLSYSNVNTESFVNKLFK